MRTTLLLATAMLAAPTLSAQALNESFDYGTTLVFPPAGWSLVDHISAGGPGWEEPSISGTPIDWQFIIADAAGHDDFNSGFSNDASLVTPTMDLSSYSTPELTFDEDLAWVNYMAHHPTTLGNGVSTIELSTDGGVTWLTEWTESTTVNGLATGLVVDLASYAGQSAAEMRFHYLGDWAHCWAIDNVVVDNGGNPTGPGLTITGTCPGVQSINAGGMTATGPVAFYYALGAGSTTIPSGGCAGLILPVAAPTQLGGFIIADGNGNASLPGASQPNHCGLVILGAVDVATCTGTNNITL